MILRNTFWHSIIQWNLSRHISLTLWSSVCHWKCERTYVTGNVGVHIWHFEQSHRNDSLPALSHWHLEPPISLSVCTIYPLKSWLAHWLWLDQRSDISDIRPNFSTLSLHSGTEAHADSSLLNIGTLRFGEFLQSCTADLTRSNTCFNVSIDVSTYVLCVGA
jgi:hypothetical protein